MFNIQLRTFIFIIARLKNLYTIIFWSIIVFIGLQLYEMAILHKHIFTSVRDLSILDDKQYRQPLIDWLIASAKITGIGAASLIILKIISEILKKLPLFTSSIHKWNMTNQITPMLGQKLISHYSYKTSLSINDFYYIYKYSDFEARVLFHNYQNPNLKSLFDRYNPKLVSEINIFDNYFIKKWNNKGDKRTINSQKSVDLDKNSQSDLGSSNFTNSTPAKNEPVLVEKLNNEQKPLNLINDSDSTSSLSTNTLTTPNVDSELFNSELAKFDRRS